MSLKRPAPDPLPYEANKRGRYEEPAAPSASSTAVSEALKIAAARAASIAMGALRAAPAAGAAVPVAAVAPAAAAGAPGVKQAAIDAAVREAMLRAQQLRAERDGTAAAAAAPKPAAAPIPMIRLGAAGDAKDVMAMPFRPVTTLKINEQNRVAPKESETITSGIPARAVNPYLAHRQHDKGAAAAAAAAEPAYSKRQARARHGLQFLEAGVLSGRAHSDLKTQAHTLAMREHYTAGSQANPVHHPELEDEEAEAGAADGTGKADGATDAGATSAAAAAAGSTAAATPSLALPPVPPKMRIVPLASAAVSLTMTPAAATAAGYGVGSAGAARAALSGAAAAAAAAAGGAGGLPVTSVHVQPLDVEWWDAAFLPLDRTKAFAVQHSNASVEAARSSIRAARAAAAGTASVFDDPAAAASSGATAGRGSAADGAGDDGDDASPAHARFSYAECTIDHQKTWAFVQHPVPVVSDADAAAAAAPTTIPLMLTKEEMKRDRRQRRAQRHQEMLDKQRLGLLPPPEPRVRIANLMRVLMDAAVADPSALEAQVRAQMAERRRNHEMRGLAQKLTPAERREKWMKKMTDHGPQGPEAALFRVPALVNKRIRYKVDVSAKDTYISGVVVEVRTAPYALLYVEGGSRAMRRYVRLMTARVDWHKAPLTVKEAEGGEDDDEEEDEDDDAAAAAAAASLHAGVVSPNGVGSGPGSLCELVWRGTTGKRHYDRLMFEEVRTPAAARKLLEPAGLTHLWDMVHHSAEVAGLEKRADGSSGAAGAGGALAAIQSQFASGGFFAATPLFATSSSSSSAGGGAVGGAGTAASAGGGGGGAGARMAGIEDLVAGDHSDDDDDE